MDVLPASDQQAALPGLADGVQLLGQYADSGLRDAGYLVRRSDGQVLQLTRLLYLVISHLDGRADASLVAGRVSADLGRLVSAANVVQLVERKVRPTGLLAVPGHRPALQRANPLLGLRLRLPLVPERAHRVVTGSLQPLFRSPIVAAVLVGLVALDSWLILGPGQETFAAARSIVYEPHRLLPLAALVIVMGVFHESGHAAAARYGGATPGAMGAGIYLIWPVFYTDVTDAYRLDRRGRLRTDLGGVYFNVVFMLAVASLYGATENGLFLAFLLFAHIETLRQFLPFVRLDGYHIVGDLAGVPNPFAYLRPTLGAAIRYFRGNPQHAPGTRQLRRLTRRARVILNVWIGATSAVLLANVVLFVVFAPRVAGMTWASAQRQIDVLRLYASAGGGVSELLQSAVGLAFLILPAVGVAYVVVLLTRRLVSAIRRGWRARRFLAAGVTTAIAGAFLIQCVVLWPDRFTDATRQADSAAEATVNP